MNNETAKLKSAFNHFQQARQYKEECTRRAKLEKLANMCKTIFEFTWFAEIIAGIYFCIVVGIVDFILRFIIMFGIVESISDWILEKSVILQEFLQKFENEEFEFIFWFVLLLVIASYFLYSASIWESLIW